jgi:hypothetical protein
MILKSSRIIRASVQQCFDLTRSIDVHVYTARSITGKAVSGKTSGLAELGDVTTWSAQFFGLNFALTTKVITLQAPYELSEQLERGLFKKFEHVYSLHNLGDGTTELEDVFTFVSPFGWLGRLFDLCVLQKVMRHVMETRLDDIKRLAETS